MVKLKILAFVVLLILAVGAFQIQNPSTGSIAANSGNAGALAYYAAASGSTALSPDASLTDSGTNLNYSGGTISAGTAGTTTGTLSVSGSNSGTINLSCATSTCATWSSASPIQSTSNSGMAMKHLQQISATNFAGTCAMNTSTTCTGTINASYTTPVCLATVQSGTVIAGACTVSSTTVTVTAASSNSSTWGFMVFGNPN